MKALVALVLSIGLFSGNAGAQSGRVFMIQDPEWVTIINEHGHYRIFREGPAYLPPGGSCVARGRVLFIAAESSYQSRVRALESGTGTGCIAGAEFIVPNARLRAH